MKKLLLLFFLMLLVQCGFSTVSILLPIEKTVESNGTVLFGSAQAGETVLVSIERKYGNIKWDSARIDESLLPKDWSYSVETKDKSINLMISIPAGERTASRNIVITVFNETLEESFNAVLKIEKGLIVPEIRARKIEVPVNECAVFSLKAFNKSIAGHTIKIESDLPDYWFSSREFSIKPLETIDVNLEVCGKSPGYREFSFYVDSSLNNERIAFFPEEISVLPTLQGEYTSIGSGFPFFSVTVFPFYLVDFFLSSFSLETDFS